MTQSQGRIFDDFAKLMNDAAGVAQSARREVETVFRSQADRVASELDLVRREDLEIVKELAARAVAEVERLAARVTELEARVAVQTATTGAPVAATASASSSANVSDTPPVTAHAATPDGASGGA